jgi:hypothetical protein
MPLKSWDNFPLNEGIMPFSGAKWRKAASIASLLGGQRLKMDYRCSRA